MALTEQAPVTADLMSERELAEQFGKSLRTIKRWRNLRIGPPVIKVGQAIYYRREAVRQWLLDMERDQARAGRQKRRRQGAA